MKGWRSVRGERGCSFFSEENKEGCLDGVRKRPAQQHAEKKVVFNVALSAFFASPHATTVYHKCHLLLVSALCFFF